jgi:RHS repeat-associated protein
LNDSNPGFQPFGYAGGIIDHDTGLGRFGARDYDPRSGTFSTKDQLIFKSASPNPYIYCRANPINCIDVSGLADINYAACSTADIEASASINDPGALDVTSHSYYVDENNLEHGDYRPNRPSCRLDEYGDRQNPAVTPDDMVADIKGHKEFPSSTHINLFLCGAANGDDPLGQYVADQTGLPVLASYGPARATPNGPSGFNLQFWFIPN